MILILVRHGEAVQDVVDPHRPLSSRGRQEVERTARFLKNLGVRVGKFVHSSKLRAEETAMILRDVLNPQGTLVKKEYLGPNDSLEPILSEIDHAKESFLIAGHMPFLALLATQLLAGQSERAVVGLATGSALILEKTNERWSIQSLVDPQGL